MLVFSSAEITKSCGPNARPSQRPWYKSKMGPARSANRGSRGNSQLRWRQGRIASASNQRHSVVPLTVATSPRASTSRRSSGNDHRASGRPAAAGSSHAIRFTSTTTLGGKAGFPPASWLLIQAGEALEKEALAPFADDLSRRIQSSGNDVVRESFGREQHEFGADDVTIR